MKNILEKSFTGILMAILLISCSSVEQNRVEKSDEYKNKPIKFEKILRFNGNIKFYKSTNRFFVYENKILKVYNNLNLIHEAKLKHAGRFEWGLNGEKIYFISYNSFIKDYHWLNSGKIKYLDISKKKIFPVTERSNFSFFNFIDNERFLAIRLGSIWIYEESDDGYSYNKILNGNCLKAFAFNDLIAVYRRLDSDIIQFVDYDGKILEEFQIKKQSSSSLPNYAFKKENNSVILYLENSIKEFTIYGTDVIKKESKSVEYEPISKNIQIGENSFYWEKKNNLILFYNKYEDKKEFLYKLKRSHPVKFFRKDNVVYFRWLNGMLTFKIAKDI